MTNADWWEGLTTPTEEEFVAARKALDPCDEDEAATCDEITWSVLEQAVPRIVAAAYREAARAIRGEAINGPEVWEVFYHDMARHLERLATEAENRGSR